jgi:hypothetical protein
MQVKKQAERIRERLKVKGKVQERRLTGPEKVGRKGIAKQENRPRIRQWPTTVGERGKEGRQDQRKAKVKGKVQERRLTGPEKGREERYTKAGKQAEN